MCFLQCPGLLRDRSEHMHLRKRTAYAFGDMDRRWCTSLNRGASFTPKDTKMKNVKLLIITLFILIVFSSFTWSSRNLRLQQLNSELITACNQLDLSSVRKALSMGACPNTLDFSLCPQPTLYEHLTVLFTHSSSKKVYRRTAMETAFEVCLFPENIREEKIIAIIQVLLDAGADPNVCNSVGEPLVDRASDYGYNRCCAMLLKRGARPAIPNKCLVRACKANEMETIELLLQRGANSNATVHLSCVSVSTPLQCAVDENHIDMVSLLLHHGANPNQHLEGTDISLLAWAQCKHEPRIATLLKNACTKHSGVTFDVSPWQARELENANFR